MAACPQSDQRCRLPCSRRLAAGRTRRTVIVSLTAAPVLNRTVWPFDRANKRRLGAFALLRRLRRERPDLVVIEGTSIAAGAVVLVGRFVFGVPYVVSSGDAVGPFIRLIAPRLGPLGYALRVRAVPLLRRIHRLDALPRRPRHDARSTARDDRRELGPAARPADPGRSRGRATGARHRRRTRSCSASSGR